MEIVIQTLSVLCAYLLGAIPFGLILARAAGVDIRKTGSGNIGATNVFRSVGKKLGILVFALDALKGYVAVAVIPSATAAHSGLLPVICGIAAIAGHNWPVYLKFKGGKGIATSAGVLMGIAPAAVGAGLAAWILVFLVFGYVSLASIAAACVVAVAAWVLYLPESIALPAVLTILAGIAVIRHKSNIQRLAAGTESKFAFGKLRQNR